MITNVLKKQGENLQLTEAEDKICLFRIEVDSWEFVDEQ